MAQNLLAAGLRKMPSSEQEKFRARLEFTGQTKKVELKALFVCNLTVEKRSQFSQIYVSFEKNIILNSFIFGVV